MLQHPLPPKLCDSSVASAFGDKLLRIVRVRSVPLGPSRVGLDITPNGEAGDARCCFGIECCELRLAVESRENRKLLRIGLGDSRRDVPVILPNTAPSALAEASTPTLPALESE